MSRLLGLIRTTPAYRQERPLVVVGLLLLLEGILVRLVGLWRGAEVPPEGDLFKASAAFVSLGLFSLTASTYLPHAGFRPFARWAWRWIVVAAVAYGGIFQLIIHAMGVDPRLSLDPMIRFRVISDTILGFRYTLWITSQIYMVFFGVLGRALLCHDEPSVLANRAMRYGVFSAGIGVASGWWMLFRWAFMNEGRWIGEHGDITGVHALGFHGFLMFPLLGWMLERSDAPSRAQRLLLHVAAVPYLAASVPLAIETARGHRLASLTPCTVLAASLLGLPATVLIVAAARAFRSARASVDQRSNYA